MDLGDDLELGNNGTWVRIFVETISLIPVWLQCSIAMLWQSWFIAR